MADPLADFADLDLDRGARRGYPEAVYCAGKTPEQLAAIAAAVRDRTDIVTLFTRAGPAHAKAVLNVLPHAHHDTDAGLLAWPPVPAEPTGGLVVVVAAGTSDLPVAREALLTARYLGRATELVVDVGVAGLHRILARLDLLRRARVVVVAAGMDGALPSVVAGLVAAPGRRGARPPSGTAPPSAGWPRCWPCSTPAPRASPWSTSTTGTAPATSPRRSPPRRARRRNDRRPARLDRCVRGRRR